MLTAPWEPLTPKEVTEAEEKAPILKEMEAAFKAASGAERQRLYLIWIRKCASIRREAGRAKAQCRQLLKQHSAVTAALSNVTFLQDLISSNHEQENDDAGTEAAVVSPERYDLLDSKVKSTAQLADLTTLIRLGVLSDNMSYRHPRERLDLWAGALI
ncbi:unnamed protein product [Tilletia controversa]|uniref:Uncharacterized protein n=1 Tax=Tilletia controversa TaxID=13291 RepID=A0A8X7MKW1_9BASI|nr:hypothetical protein A4X06_0g8599 [Tilletia controversa]CAD6922493.1 unnamed protein product [Tilletia controversa]CAD6957221.1 unnamed protein product [Tilletia controversa]CAD6969444.1 unnamed protein product [Tilletia controversa]CAD6984319.1 unnamed protein product [Tilletia controversa]